MEALNALRLKPICVLPEKARKPRKSFNVPTLSPPKFSEKLSRSFHGSLVLLSSILGTNTAKLANALTYEEALQQSVNTEAAGDFDASSVVDSIVSFSAENPVVIAGGFAVFAVPLILSQVLGKPKPFGVESAKSAYAKLADDPTAQLLDIRSLKDFREVGSPDVRGLKKKPVPVVYKSEDKPGFLQKLSLKFKEPEKTTLFILDKFDGNSELVAELVTANGFKAAYAIKDGAEGARGWMNSGLPWILPKKTFSLDLGDLTESISGVFSEASDTLPVALGFAAATGLGLLAFTEVETILQLLGSAAIIQVISKKLLFAEDRKVTLKQADEFLNTKIAPKELVAEIKQIGVALLPSPVSTKALPAPAEASAGTVVANDTVQKAEAIPELNAEPKAEAPAEPTPEINSVPKSVQTRLPSSSSPYISYPDLKPPSSPCPSQP